MEKLYVIDDTANDDEDENRGQTGWMVTTNEAGDEEEDVVAYFKTEKQAEAYVEWMNNK